MSKKCFIMGHRDARKDIFSMLCNCIEKCIEFDGVDEFIVGNYGSFDKMAAKAVNLSKMKRANIKLTPILPYHPAERKSAISSEFNELWYPDGIDKVPHRFRIVSANRVAVDTCDVLILYCRYTGSNTEKIAEYARKKGKQIIYVNDP